MVRITVDFGPLQEPITKKRIEQMLTLRPRRMKLSREWPDALHEPPSDDKDWSLVLPFCETLKNAFTSCPVEHIGLRASKEGGRCYTFFSDAKENKSTLKEVRKWLEAVGQFVALRDCLALSFVLDYDRTDGNPNNPQTTVGALRTRAKPYDAKPTDDTYKAADKLVSSCVAFIRTLSCYGSADAVVAMPPSRPDKPFDLPTYLAGGVAQALGLADCSEAVSTLKARPPLKDTALAAKLEALAGSVRVKPGSIKGKTVLLIDDLYQSGVSMNYVGMLLLEGGAKKVFGLACEKTCRNDDNLSSSSG